MRVKELIAHLQKLDPEATVVTSGFDHSYDRVTGIEPTKADMNDKRKLFEHYADDTTFQVVSVVVLT